jgi:predicted dehydrogenase
VGEIKVGMIGLDTSHCPAFTRLLNDDSNEYHVPGARVVGAYPGGSDLFSLSRDRVQGFTEELRDTYGVPIYDSIPALVTDVDAILLESADGRQHLEQFEQIVAQSPAGPKPVFVDKPFATSTVDARRMIQLAVQTQTPMMSSSSLRYAAGIVGLAGEGERVLSCEAFGPAAILDDYPGLFWYGIHSAEMLYTYMGLGCEAVRCLPYEDVDVVIGQWQDGRIGVVRGTRFKGGQFGCVVHADNSTRCGFAQSTPPGYYGLMQVVVAFFQTGVAPIDVRETFEIASFLEAANRSREHGGQITRLECL